LPQSQRVKFAFSFLIVNSLHSTIESCDDICLLSKWRNWKNSKMGHLWLPFFPPNIAWLVTKMEEECVIKIVKYEW